MMNPLGPGKHVRRLAIVLATVPAFLLLYRSWAGQPGANGDPSWGPRTGLCTRCFQIYWFMGGGDGSSYTPAGMLRDEVCPACDVSAGYEKPPSGTAPGKSAGDARNKHRGVANGGESYKKRQGELPAAEYAGGKQQLDLDLDSLNNHWEHLKNTFHVLGTISDSGAPKIGKVKTPVAVDKMRAALRDDCVRTAKAAASLAAEERANLLLECMLFAVAQPEKKDSTSVGIGRLVALRQESAAAYQLLAAGFGPLEEAKLDEGVQARPYYQPAAPKADLLSKNQAAKDQQLWIDTCNGRIRVNAMLIAVADNWIRHQRASNQQDMRAVAGLSTRMIELAMMARAQSLNEASANLDFQRARLEIVDRILKENPGWKQSWENLRRQSLADQKIPKEANDAWKLLGMPGDPGKDVLALAAMDSAEIEKLLSERRGRLTVMHEVRTILQKDKLSWPQPYDFTTLDKLEQFGRRVFPEFPAKVLYHVSSFDSGWWAVPSGGTVDFRRKGVMHAAHTTYFLAPGKYDIWIPLKHPNVADLPPAVRIFSGIELAAGKPMKPLQKPKSFPEKSGPRTYGEFTLRVGEGIAPPFSWFLFPQDANFTDQAIKGTSTFETLKVPVGKYDLYWYATSEHAPLVLARGLEIGDKQSVTWELDTGISLERGKGIPAQLSSGWWGATLPGQAPVRRVNWTASSDRLLLPPGEYDVYWTYGRGHLAVRIASGVSVKAKSWSPVRIASGLGVKLSPAFPKIHGEKGWLAAAIADTDDLVDLRFGNETNIPLVLPPGKFDLIVQFDGKTQPQRLSTRIAVPAASVTEVVLEARKPK